MFEFNNIFKKNTLIQNSDELIWEISAFKKSARIVYGGQEFGSLKVKGIFKPKADGKLLDRLISIRPANFWATKYLIRDKTSEEDIAVLERFFLLGKIKIILNNNDTFIWKQNIWGRGSWWWQKINDKGLPCRESVKAKVANFILGQKGRLHLNHVEEENLNAMIIGGLFIKILKDQGNT